MLFAECLIADTQVFNDSFDRPMAVQQPMSERHHPQHVDIDTWTTMPPIRVVLPFVHLNFFGKDVADSTSSSDLGEEILRKVSAHMNNYRRAGDGSSHLGSSCGSLLVCGGSLGLVSVYGP